MMSALLWFSLLALAQEKADSTLLLAIGDPGLKDRTLDVGAGQLYSGLTGEPLLFPKMIQEMTGSRFIYIGESHNDMAMHDIQLQIIRALYEKNTPIAIGLEMLPTETQPVLERWNQGLLSQDDFLRQVRWYIHWNMNFGFYEKIFNFAREKKIPLYALNVPRELITKIRIKGWEALTDEEKSLASQPDLSSEDHRTLIRAIFESTELPHQMKGEGLDKVFEGLYRAQAAWDEIMAANAIQGQERETGVMVVLAGSGHLLYNLGINRRVYEKTRLPSRTVVAVSLSPEAQSIRVSRSLADFIWGIPEQELPAFPSVGLAFKKVEGLENLVIERKPIDGAALGGDFEKGDIVLSVDDQEFSEINELRIYLARFTWDQETRIRLLRNGEIKDVALKFIFKAPTVGMPLQAKTAEGKTKNAMTQPDRLDRLRKEIEGLIRGAEGEVGVAIKHLESGKGLGLNEGSAFPMASVFKLPLLVEIMAQVKEGRLSLDEEVSVEKTDQHLGSGMLSSLTAPGIKLSLRNLINLMMMISDNSATDILLEKAGAENVNRRLKQWGIGGISVNRSCQELIMDFVGLDYEKFKGLSLDQVGQEYKKLGERNPEAYRRAVLDFSRDPQDQSTPLAMNSLLEKVFQKQILDPESCELILSIMLNCQTGEGRIKGGLPPGTPVAHKTGTIAGTVNDCGIIYLPDGQGHVALSVLTKNFLDKTNSVEDVIAKIARFVYDFFYFAL